jgi:hypothetical protein
MILRRRRSDGAPFWGCERFPTCKATHGAHPDGTPLGIPGTRDEKAARRSAHAAIDVIWQSGRMNRGGVYAWLERSMQLPKGEGHVGRFNVEQCEQAIQLANAFMAVDAEDPLREERSRIRLGLESKFGKNRGRQARKWLGAAIGLETKALVHELTAQQCQTALEELQKLTARQP